MTRKSKTLGWVGRGLLGMGVGVLIVSFFAPWAYGKTVLGLASQTVYPYRNSSLRLALGLLMLMLGLIFFSVLYRFYTRFVLFLSGVGIFALGFYLWNRIETSDLRLLGLAPLKLAEARPGPGVFLLVAAGFFLALAGLAGKNK